MSLWTRIGAAVGALRGSQTTLGHPRDPVIKEWWSEYLSTSSGMSVTPESARRVGAVYACVKVLAETVAGLPLNVYKRTNNGRGRARDTAHPLWDLLHFAPSEWQTSFEMRETMVGHTLLRGAAYLGKVPDGKGWFRELRLLHPNHMTPMVTKAGRPAWEYAPPNQDKRVLLTDDVVPMPSWSDDGMTPLSVISLHRETIGKTMAVAEYGSRFFGNNAMPKGAVKMPQTLGTEAAQLLRESWEKRHRGVENAHKIAVLDGGMEWQTIGVSNDDAQFIETMKFSIIEICRIFRVPPHLIADLERATFSNIEHQAISFVLYTLLPHIIRQEQRLNRGLLTVEQRRTHYIAYDIKGLLRGDEAARASFYDKLFRMGALSPNDIRRLEDMDEITGGDVYYVPLQVAPADRLLDVLLKTGPAELKPPAPPPNEGQEAP